MNNEELESKLLLIKQSIDALQEELAPNLKTKDLVLLRYGYNVDEIKKLNDYLFKLTMNKNRVTKKEFERKSQKDIQFLLKSRKLKNYLFYSDKFIKCLIFILKILKF